MSMMGVVTLWCVSVEVGEWVGGCGSSVSEGYSRWVVRVYCGSEGYSRWVVRVR